MAENNHSRAVGQALDSEAGHAITNGIPISAFLMSNMQSCRVRLDQAEGTTDP